MYSEGPVKGHPKWAAGCAFFLYEREGKLLGQCGHGKLLRDTEDEIRSRQEKYKAREEAKMDIFKYMEIFYNR